MAEAVPLPSPSTTPETAAQVHDNVPLGARVGCLRPAIVAIDGPAGSGKARSALPSPGCAASFLRYRHHVSAVTLVALQAASR